MKRTLSKLLTWLLVVAMVASMGFTALAEEPEAAAEPEEVEAVAEAPAEEPAAEEPAGPSITAQPENVAAAEGETAVFTVETDGEVRRCQWETSADGENWSVLSSRYYGNKTTLGIPATEDFAGVLFRAVVTLKDGTILTSEAASLTLAEEIVMPAQVFDGGAGDVAVSIDAPEGAFPEGTEMTVEEVSVADAQALVDADASISGKVLAAADISFFYEGEDIQPGEPVTVNFTSDAVAGAENVTVYHVGENGLEPVEMKEAAAPVMKAAADDSVAFTADGFSVYVVVDSGSSNEARATVNFYNGSTKIATMYVKNSDTLAELATILYDPGSGDLAEDELFMGWTTEQQYNSETTRMDIDGVRAEMEAKTISEGDVVNYYAIIAKVLTVTYYSEADTEGVRRVVKQQSAYLVGSDASVTTTVLANYTPSTSTQNFEGWKVLKGAANIVEPTLSGDDAYYSNNTDIKIKGDVDLVAYAPDGAWLIFDENGRGATYCAPQFVKSEGVTKKPRADSDMTRRGYTFGGWYTDADCTDGNEFEFGKALASTQTIYAKWDPNTTAPYTVIFWTQSLDRGHYDLKESVPVQNGTVGQYIQYSFTDNNDEGYATFQGKDYHYTGFDLTEASRNQQVEITPEGDAVLNLYFDRIKYEFKFYLYRSNGANWDYANNSGSGSELNTAPNSNQGLVTWHQNQANHPGVSASSGYTIQSETIGTGNNARTYYYFTIEAYYEQDISKIWPTYDKITGAQSGNSTREAVSYVMMVGTKLKPTGTSSGSGTVKGIITVMNENILGATNDADGNYVVVRFPDNYYNWRYHIWYQCANNDPANAPEGKTTYEYENNYYYEDTVLTVRSSNTDERNQNEPKYQGFDYVMRVGQDRNGNWEASNSITQTDTNGKKAGEHWNTNAAGEWINHTDNTQNDNTLYHLNYIYDRQEFRVTYFDGVYIDVDDPNAPLLSRPDQELHQSALIAYGSPTASCDDYDPSAEGEPGPYEPGYVFDGWYADAACQTPVVWTTMPVGGFNVYARWVRSEYRVLMNPNAGTQSSDPDLSWGSDTVSLSFKIDYRGKVNTPTGTRPGYDFIGWYYTADDGVFMTNTQVTDDNTVPYDKTEPTELDKWGEDTSGHDWNKDLDPNDDGDTKDERYWVTRKLEIYAVWSKIAEGAPGVQVVYDKGASTATDPGLPTDNNYYQDATVAIAQGGCNGYSVTTTNADGEEETTEYVFDKWVVQKYNKTSGKYEDTTVQVNPGNGFTVNIDDAKQVIISQTTDPNTGVTTITEATYTLQLKAVYTPKEKVTPTHITWYQNDGVTLTPLQEDTDILINQGVNIYKTKVDADGIGTGEADEIPTRPGYVFLGWARLNDKTETTNPHDPEDQPFEYTEGEITDDDIILWYNEADGKYYKEKTFTNLAKQVAADERHPYHDLYAVWDVGYFYVYHSSTGKLEAVDFTNVNDDGTYDLTAKVTSGTLYGGWYTACGGATEANVKKAFTPAQEATDKQAAVTGAATYDGKQLKNGTVRFWEKDTAGKTKGSEVKPEVDDVFYLKEVPAIYLCTYGKWVYDWAKDDEILDLYLLTGVDESTYSEVGFIITYQEDDEIKTTNLATSFSYKNRNSTADVTKIKAADLIGQRGYLGVVDASSYIANILEGSVIVRPYWKTLDGVQIKTAGYTLSCTESGAAKLTNDNINCQSNAS